MIKIRNMKKTIGIILAIFCVCLVIAFLISIIEFQTATIIITVWFSAISLSLLLKWLLKDEDND